MVTLSQKEIGPTCTIEDMKPEVIEFSRENLIALRKKRRLGQNDMAEHLGVTRPAYQNLEKINANPTRKNLIALGRILNVIWTLDYRKEEAPVD